MRYIKWLLFIYLLLKPYYFFSSGGLQIADIFLILAFIIFIIIGRLNKSIYRYLIEFFKENKQLIIFIAFVLIINFLYFLLLNQFKFLLSSLYYIFIFMALTTFSFYMSDNLFLLNIKKIFIFNLLLQLLIFAFGIGRYYDPIRYMGTFNDPNQFGFYVFLSLLFIYGIGSLTERKKELFYIIPISSMLIYLSVSTGMLFGLAIFLILLVIYKYSSVKTNQRLYKNTVYIILTTLLFIFTTLLFVHPGAIQTAKNTAVLFNGNPAAERLEQKASKSNGDADASLFEERGYDKIVYYPVKVLYGAGEGAYERFRLARYEGEIHAALPSILFYYGIIPFYFALAWFYRQFKMANAQLKIVYIALLAESFTLLNQRQTLFWLLFVIPQSIITTRSLTKTSKRDLLS